MTDVVQNADMRMIEFRNSFRFALQPCVTGAVDLTHPARGEQYGEFIRAQVHTWGEGHRVWNYALHSAIPCLDLVVAALSLFMVWSLRFLSGSTRVCRANNGELRCPAIQ